VKFYRGEGDFLDEISFFLEEKIPWEKNNDIVSKRRE